MLVDLVQVQYQRAQSGIMRVGQIVDNGMNCVATDCVIVDASGFNEARVVDVCHERVRQVAEELFE